ncbi:hypothetical protein IFM89_005527 [Coptis chinensis]|uniref:Uncharacterized protein n=1 Tax=Coptis chinensis TaxID=261450 RepID=A0A835I9H7_9MAGN|nr:hypothetical protein IFM89_005527 [Coptis chinensis]
MMASSSSGTLHFSPSMIVFVHIESSGFDSICFGCCCSSFRDRIPLSFTLRLALSLRLCVRIVNNGDFGGDCCWTCGVILSVSSTNVGGGDGEGNGGGDPDGGDGAGDFVFVASVLVTSCMEDFDASGDEDFLFRDRALAPHSAAIMRIVAATDAVRKEKENAG